MNTHTLTESASAYERDGRSSISSIFYTADTLYIILALE